MTAQNYTPFSLYIHIPFCASICGYCDFNTYTAQELGGGVSQGTFQIVDPRTRIGITCDQFATGVHGICRWGNTHADRF
jgi:hypothetical protein